MKNNWRDCYMIIIETFLRKAEIFTQKLLTSNNNSKINTLDDNHINNNQINDNWI